MKKLTTLCLFLILSLSAVAVEDNQVTYVGGTAPDVEAGAVGQLDTTSETALVFKSSGRKLEIPYFAIQSFQYSREVPRHLGVLPAIAIGMLKVRRHQHFFRISYRDSNHLAQVAIFEVPKHTPRTLQAVLETRAPQTCKPYLRCTGKN